MSDSDSTPPNTIFFQGSNSTPSLKDFKKPGTGRTCTTSTSSSTSRKTATTTGGGVAKAMAQPPAGSTTTTIGAFRSPSVDLGSLGRMVAEREEALGRDKPRAKKRWTADETKKLKLALKIAGDPTTDETWELISRSIGGHRTVDECRDQAAKQLRWKPPPPLPPGVVIIERTQAPFALLNAREKTLK
uniref:Myb-like domain-containing protein n=1 Tax=Globodera pallida TaxID=36090 RepID=A0A183C516_GLOPA